MYRRCSDRGYRSTMVKQFETVLGLPWSGQVKSLNFDCLQSASQLLLQVGHFRVCIFMLLFLHMFSYLPFKQALFENPMFDRSLLRHIEGASVPFVRELQLHPEVKGKIWIDEFNDEQKQCSHRGSNHCCRIQTERVSLKQRTTGWIEKLQICFDKSSFPCTSNLPSEKSRILIQWLGALKFNFSQWFFLKMRHCSEAYLAVVEVQKWAGTENYRKCSISVMLYVQVVKIGWINWISAFLTA